MLELWETAEAKTLRALHKKKKSVGHQFEEVEQKSEHHPSSELEVEKELVGDKSAVPTSFNEPNQAHNKRKLLERLDSNAQKFNTLQITVEELRREIGNKQEEEKGEQVEEVEETSTAGRSQKSTDEENGSGSFADGW